MRTCTMTRRTPSRKIHDRPTTMPAGGRGQRPSHCRRPHRCRRLCRPSPGARGQGRGAAGESRSSSLVPDGVIVIVVVVDCIVHLVRRRNVVFWRRRRHQQLRRPSPGAQGRGQAAAGESRSSSRCRLPAASSSTIASSVPRRAMSKTGSGGRIPFVVATSSSGVVRLQSPGARGRGRGAAGESRSSLRRLLPVALPSSS